MRWWRITKRNADLERELRSDLELEEEEQRERGVPAEEARHAALRAFGNPTLIREQTHAVWSWSWLESFASDLKYGFRGMHRNAGSTIFGILIVSLGIGAASTVFSVVNALLLRPLPFRDPGRLVWITNGERLYLHPTRTLLRPPGAEPVLLRSGGLVRNLQFRRHGIDRDRRAGAAYQRSGYREFLRLAGSGARNRTIVYEGGEPGQVFRSGRHAVEFELLAQAVRFGPERGGAEADVEQSAGDDHRCLARVVRLRERLCPGHSNRYFYSLAANGRNETRRKHDEDRRKVETTRHRRERAG